MSVIHIHIALAILTFVIANVLAYQSSNERKPVSIMGFIWRQIYFTITNPGHAVMVTWGILLMPYLTLPLLLGDRQFFDMCEGRRETVQKNYLYDKKTSTCQLNRHEWYELSCQQQHAVDDGLEGCDASAQFLQALGKVTSGMAILLGLLVSPFAATVARAKTKDKEDQRQVQPINTKEGDLAAGSPPPKYFLPEIHGAILGQTDISVAPDGIDDPSASMRVVNLVLKGNGPAQTDYLVIANLAVLPANNPVFVASASWEPFDGTQLTAGRVISPVGLMRNPPPHLLTTLTYANQPLTSALFDQGALVRQTLFEDLTLEGGILSGAGIAPDAELAPEAVGRAELQLNTLRAGIAGVLGTRTEGHQHSLAVYAELTPDNWLFQTELVGSLQTENRLAADISTAVLAAWRPNEYIEPYVRTDMLFSDILSQGPPMARLDAGINLKLGFAALRLAIEKHLTQGTPLRLHAAAQASF